MLIYPLENLGLVSCNVINTGAFNVYWAKGINLHFDEHTRFDEQSSVYSVTAENGKTMRFGAGVRAKNPLFYVDLLAPQLFRMEHHSFGTCFVKHGFTCKDINDRTCTFIMRRVYPFLMLMSAQYRRHSK